jgi:hypothetical protein
MANVSAPSASNSMSNVAQKRKQSDVSDKSKKKKVEKKQWDYEETVQLITSMEDASIRAKMDGMVHNSVAIGAAVFGGDGEEYSTNAAK